MDTYLNSNTKVSNIYLICPNCNSFISNKSFNSFNNFLGRNFESLTDNLFLNVKIFHKNLSILKSNIKNITTGLENQIHHAKSLMKLIMVKKNNNFERYCQLNDRIDIIGESKKILDDNISLVYENVKIFINDINNNAKTIKNKISLKNNLNINIDKFDDTKENIIKYNPSTEKNINSYENKTIFKDLDNLVNNVKLKEYEHNNNHSGSNNTLIFPNNINQNIFNYTITSKEFQKMKKDKNFGFFKNNSTNKDKLKKILKEKIENRTNINKLLRSSSSPELKNNKVFNNKYKSNIFNNNIYMLCYKVTDFFTYLNNNDVDENIIKEKIEEINILINSILNEKNNNIINQENNIINPKNDLFQKNENFEENNNIGQNKNNSELIENVGILTEKINGLEKKIIEKNEYIKYIKKYSKITNNKDNKNEIIDSEINQKEQNIKKLRDSINVYEQEKKDKENNEHLLSEKNDELKNSLLEKNEVIQGMNIQIIKYKNEIDDLNKKLKHSKDESQLIMEMASLKKINSNLNIKLNQLKKKLNQNSNTNSFNEKELEIISLKENYKDLIEQNKDIKLENEYLKVENNKNEGEINKLKKEIGELNHKLIEKDLKKQKNLKSLTDTEHFNLSKNSDEHRNSNKIIIEKQIEICILKNEFEIIKKDLDDELKLKLNEKDAKIYSYENYNILCDKNFKNLQWFLLIPKTKKFSNVYEDLIWVSRKQINNIDKFNQFVSEYEEQNKLIVDNLLKLEKKEETISKLKYKINCFEKNINTSPEISDNNMDISSIGIEKINKILAKLNDTEKKLKILQIENKQLKEKISENNNSHNIQKPISNDESNKLAYNKNYSLIVENDNNENKKVDNNEEEQEEEVEEGEEYEESESLINDLRDELEKTKIELDRIKNKYNDLLNKFDLLKENLSSLLLKMKIPKKYTSDLTEILKIFEFTDNEILFILNKKGLF